MVVHNTSLPAAALVIACLLGCSSHTGSTDNVQLADRESADALQPATGGELVLIPAGQFLMGDPNGRADEAPHRVSVSSFYMDKYLVTQEMFEAITGKNPSKHQGPDHPVERTQWVDAVRFCNRCSELEGLTPCYDLETWECDYTANGYRLPTEAEWEYACRAGTQTRYFFGDDERELEKYAWCKPHSRGRTHPVGEKRANPWGLFDIHGNVWQWCHDYYSETYYAESPSQDPRGPDSGDQRVLRGGAWKVSADKCRAAYRSREFPVFTDACFGSDSYGFRRVRSAATAQHVDLADRAAQQTEPEPPAIKSSLATAEQQRVVDQDATDQDPNELLPAETAPIEVTPLAASGSISQDRLRGTIVFVSDRSGGLEVWKMHASGTKLQQLTADEHADADPKFSPDGQRILYTSLRDGFPEVWLMRRDGSQPRRITEGSQASWSPDGKSIVFIREDQALVRRLDSGEERRITPDNWQRCGVPAWSPDGAKIAVASRHLGNIGIFVLALETEQHSQLETEEPCCTPQWAADGQRVIFQTVQGHIHELDTVSGVEEQLTFGADIQHEARYSPDGSMLVFCRAPTSSGPWQLCVVDLESDDLDTVQITSEGSNRLPDWHAVEDAS